MRTVRSTTSLPCARGAWTRATHAVGIAVPGALAAGLIAACMFAGSAHGEVYRRGGGVIDQPIVEVSLAGVGVGGDAPRTIGWDDVRAVTGSHAGDADAFMDLAEDAWRARTRLDRGDLPLAAPLYASLYERYRDDGDGPTASVVASGHARCLVAQGRTTDAVVPWLRFVEMNPRQGQAAEGVRVGSSARSGWFEPGSGLAPALAPVFLPSDATERLASARTMPDAGADAVQTPAEALGMLYVASAAYEIARAEAQRVSGTGEQVTNSAGGSLPELSGEAAGDPAVLFVRDLVASRIGDDKVRAIARDRLSEDLDAQVGTWREAWRRAAIGRSLLMEADPRARERGLVHLAHLPARFMQSQPTLSAIALAEMSLELERLGRTGESGSVRTLLVDLAGAHTDDRAHGRSDAHADAHAEQARTDPRAALDWLDAQLAFLQRSRGSSESTIQPDIEAAPPAASDADAADTPSETRPTPEP